MPQCAQPRPGRSERWGNRPHWPHWPHWQTPYTTPRGQSAKRRCLRWENSEHAFQPHYYWPHGAIEMSRYTRQHVKLNGHHNHDPEIIQPGGQRRGLSEAKRSAYQYSAPIADLSANRPGGQRRGLSEAKRSAYQYSAPIADLSAKKLPSRPRLFPRLAAGVLAALVIIAAVFSWFAVLHRPQVPPSGHPTAIPTSNIATYRAAGGSVYRVAWSPDGTEIASTDAVGTVQIWDTVTGHTISTYRGNFLKVLSLVWSPGHSLLVTAEGADRTVQVWNALAGKRILTTPPLNGIASVATW